MKFDPTLIGKVFDSEQATVVMNLRDEVIARMDQDLETKIEDSLKRRGIDENVLGLSDQEKSYLKLKKNVEKVRKVWENNGYVEGVKDRITIGDLAEKDMKRKADWEKNGKMLDGVFSTDQPLVIPRVIEEMVRMPIEPNIVLTGLLKRINMSSAGTVVTFPAVGNAMVAADIPEGGEYPESSQEFAGEITATMGKSGIAVKLTEEMIRYSQYDVMSLHLQAARSALVRHKEQKVADMILRDQGVTFFDNSVSGYYTSGRNNIGVGNATMSYDDFLLMYADMINDGFIPDTLIVHPFMWFAWTRDPIMRSLFLNGLGGSYFQNFQGSIGSGPSFAAGGLNNLTKLTDPSQIATTYTMPGVLPTPMRVIVTPFQVCDTSAKTCTVTMAQASELGLLIVDEEVKTDEFNDVLRDIKKVKFRERYALATSNNGQAIRHAKGVNWWERNYNLADQLSWEAGTGALPSINTGSITIV
jgi:hypothetical protein